MRSPGSVTKKLQRGTFRVGITLKAFDGFLESLAGAILLVRPAALRNLSLTLWTSGHFRHTHHVGGRFVDQLTATDPIFASVYLLAHGVVKVVLAIALWMNRLWAYPAAICIFGLFVVYQVYRLQRIYSLGLLLLTIFDVVIIWLTVLEYRDQKRLQNLPAAES